MPTLTKRYWAEFIERTVRSALIVFLTAVFIDSWSDASVSWKEKLIAAGSGALLSMGLSLLSALKDPDSTWFFADKVKDSEPRTGTTLAK
jgi:hypothetical protein